MEGEEGGVDTREGHQCNGGQPIRLGARVRGRRRGGGCGCLLLLGREGVRDAHGWECAVFSP